MKQEEVWNNISPKWNKFKTRKSPSAEKFISGKKGKILDVGCGSGRNFMRVKGLKWTAIDFSANMINYAKKKAESLKMDVEIIKSDSAKMPFKKNTFDAVLCFAVIHCIDSADKRRKTLQEILRVLKPKGEALISAWGPKSLRLKNKGKECYVPWTIKDLEGKQMRYTYVFDLNELIKLCEDTGFEIISSWEERNVNVIVRKPSS